MFRDFFADVVRLDFAHLVKKLHLLIKRAVVFMAGLENLELGRGTSSVGGGEVKGDWCSTRSNVRSAVVPLRCSIAIGDDLLSAITSEEAAAVTPQMSHVFLALLAMIPDDPENSLPVEQEWLFKFDGEGGSYLSLWQQLQEVVTDVDEQELNRALDWMSGRHIIDLRFENSNLYLTIRNVMTVNTGEDRADAGLEN